MTSLRQIEANRRNARLSTGPITEQGKRRSRQNAVRHGLTAETIIGALEDADDYEAFQLAITADFEARSAVERELVLRLASVLWRLRRATAIESGLFEIQARRLLEVRQRRQTRDARQRTIKALYQNAVVSAESDRNPEIDEPSLSDRDSDALTRSFLRLTNLPTCPLDRLSRYEAALWRQASQILFALQFLDRSKPWSRLRSHLR
jgi:hypothetical protein